MADMETIIYNVGFIGEIGNGYRTVYPDVSGLIETRLPVSGTDANQQKKTYQTFIYTIDAQTLGVEMFMDLFDVTVNNAAQILTNISKNAERSGGGASRMPTTNNFPRPLLAGDTLKLNLRGEHLSIDDVLDQIYVQTHCDLVEQDGFFSAVACN